MTDICHCILKKMYAVIAPEHISYCVKGAVNKADVVYLTENQSTFYKHMNRCLSVAVNCGPVICGVAPKGNSLLGNKLLICNTRVPCETYLAI